MFAKTAIFVDFILNLVEDSGSLFRKRLVNILPWQASTTRAPSGSDADLHDRQTDEARRALRRRAAGGGTPPLSLFRLGRPHRLDLDLVQNVGCRAYGGLLPRALGGRFRSKKKIQ